MAKQLNFTFEYAAPTARMVQLGAIQCFAGSDKMSDFDTNEIFEEEFDD